jgi:hypothetical protein
MRVCGLACLVAQTGRTSQNGAAVRPICPYRGLPSDTKACLHNRERNVLACYRVWMHLGRRPVPFDFQGSLALCFRVGVLMC